MYGLNPECGTCECECCDVDMEEVQVTISGALPCCVYDAAIEVRNIDEWNAGYAARVNEERDEERQDKWWLAWAGFLVGLTVGLYVGWWR